MEQFIPFTKKTKKTIVIGLSGIILLWFVYGNRFARNLNKESLVSIGVVTRVTPNSIYYQFNDSIDSYSGAYEYKKYRHYKHEVGSKIYVRYYPPNPGIHRVLFKNKSVEIDFGIGEVLDTLNNERLRWWDFE